MDYDEAERLLRLARDIHWYQETFPPMPGDWQFVAATRGLVWVSIDKYVNSKAEEMTNP